MAWFKKKKCKTFRQVFPKMLYFLHISYFGGKYDVVLTLHST